MQSRASPVSFLLVQSPVGVAIVGAGYWGKNLIRNFLASDDFTVRWVVDYDEAVARRTLAGEGGDVRVTREISVALADPGVDAVVIATPAATHSGLGRLALEAGKHLLVEKPLAHTLAAGRELVELARQHSLTLMVDHTYCYAGPVDLLGTLIAKDELGELQTLHSTRINKGLVRLDVDVIWDLAAHDLSILTAILPSGIEMRSVQAQGADPFGDGQVKEATLTIQLSNGAVAHISVSWLSPVKQRTISVVGTKASLHWNDLDPANRVLMHGFTGERDLRPAVERGDSTRLSQPLEFTDMAEIPYDTTEALQSMVAEFARSIRSGASPKTDGAAGLAVLEALEAASASIRRGGAAVSLA